MENKPSYWAVLPAQIRYNTDLPPNAKILYAEISALTNERGHCYADNAYFCQLYGLSERTVIRLINALERAGFIKIADGGNGKTNRKIYAGINPLFSSDKNVSSRKELTKMSEGSDKNVSSKYSNNNKINNPPIVPHEGDGAPPGKRKKAQAPDWEPEIFDRFWKAYPRGEGKQAAKRAWNKLKPDAALRHTMALALKTQLDTPDWNGGIFPHASTWLNGRRWEDELQKAPHISEPVAQEGVYEQW